MKLAGGACGTQLQVFGIAINILDGFGGADFICLWFAFLLDFAICDFLSGGCLWMREKTIW